MDLQDFRGLTTILRIAYLVSGERYAIQNTEYVQAPRNPKEPD